MEAEKDNSSEPTPQMARIAGRLSRIKASRARLIERLSNKELDPRKEAAISQRLLEHDEEVELLQHEFAAGKIKQRRAAGVNISVPTAELKAEAKAPSK